MDAEFADICDAVSATQRIKHKTRLLLKKKHAPQLVRATLKQTVLVASLLNEQLLQVVCTHAA